MGRTILYGDYVTTPKEMREGNFAIRDAALEGRIKDYKLRIETSPDAGFVLFSWYDSYYNFQIEQLASNCGALVVSKIDMHHQKDMVTWLAKNYASMTGNKVLQLSTTAQVKEWEKLGWSDDYEVWSARNRRTTVHYMHLTLKEEERLHAPWKGT